MKMSTRKYFLALLFSLSFLTLTSGAKRKRLPSSAYAVPGTNATYDYLVVGGGTAGLALASRLAESFRVAVIEAGGFYELDNGNASVVPYYSLTIPSLSSSPDYPHQPLFDWDLVSQPQVGGGNRRIHYAQSKTLGGCSAHNTMAYLRSTRGTQDRWAQIAGDDSYKWDNMLPYYKKSVTLTPPNWQKRNMPNATFTYDTTAFNPAGQGGGPVQISWANWVDPAATWLAKCLQGMGMPKSDVGFTSGTLSGFGAWTNTEIDPTTAERSSATEYLKQAIENTEIMVYHQTQAMKINFDNTKRARSVLVSTMGLEYTLSASKEVIVSAGVYHSPQLLMVSGVGPKATLQKYNIPVVSDLPVGQGLQDQIWFTVSSGITSPNAIQIASDPANREILLREYLDDQSGVLSSAGGYLAFEKLPSEFRTAFSKRTASALAALPSDFPEIEYIVTGFPDGKGGSAGALTATILHPYSFGSVTISSGSMLDKPVFDMGWLTDSADTELALAAFKLGPEIAPGSAVQSDADILDYIRKNCNQMWHPSGTCRMGKAGDGKSIVDMTGLRVLDTSIFPFANPGHPTATLYALAEKLADDIT
ncbi:GMC oxidoreductase [Diplogelasinospora grovesii]|uniref:GMC oxidoreductase n=1 Tax=Diplogelasinospora grovesii TaxID=303347 RepID=A0AAN6NBP0_9PEZI|nr:GMC oxidoreductase [Diplogelasinospora grovesii]